MFLKRIRIWTILTIVKDIMFNSCQTFLILQYYNLQERLCNLRPNILFIKFILFVFGRQLNNDYKNDILLKPQTKGLNTKRIYITCTFQKQQCFSLFWNFDFEKNQLAFTSGVEETQGIANQSIEHQDHFNQVRTKGGRNSRDTLQYINSNPPSFLSHSLFWVIKFRWMYFIINHLSRCRVGF